MKIGKMACVLLTSVLVLSACSTPNADKEKPVTNVLRPHEKLNQKPTPIKIERTSPHAVQIQMTAQITDIEIAPGEKYKAWTFNGQAPGPVIAVNQGDTIHFTLKNMDPAMPHSMDMHAVHTAPSKNFADVMPDKSGSFTYKADNPGVFMYHCGTQPVLEHIANGMHGMIIVKPAGGYPTDSKVDREYVIIQNEWYKYNDMNEMTNGEPKYVVFSAKAFKEGQENTNGTVGALVDHPLQAETGDRIRFYVLNAGPNEVSSFHVVGSLFDDVYVDGNPGNHMSGMQTVLLPASGAAVVEFTVKEAGSYSFLTHQFNDAAKGAVGKIEVK